ncbi:MAG: dienelactone hydrolase family protein [Rhodopirellula sp.]|nr:dienelactone hydrolase family protein [Rhodopirellula sp.]
MTRRMRNTANCVLMATVVAWLWCSQTAAAEKTLPNTQPLTIEQPLDEFMIDGIDRFCLRELAASPARRAELWNRDFSSPEAYQKSIAANRERFREYIGAVDSRVTQSAPETFRFELLDSLEQSSVVARSSDVTVHAVRWQVLDGVTVEGLLLQPKNISAAVVAVPDADWTPEEFVGLDGSIPESARLPWRLAKEGCLVVVPMLISRSDEFSGSPYVAYTNQTHREFIYRQAFEMGRHVIGYEVQKILAAVDLLEQFAGQAKHEWPIGVAGIGEGGLLALYSAALDPRIDATLVSGYFSTRESVWEEPIYRNVWGLLTEFGDAELAGLIAPRSLTIEACAVPESAGPPAVRSGRRGGAAPGRIETATLGAVRAEFDRAAEIFHKLDSADQLTLVASGEGDGPAGTTEALTAFLSGIGIEAKSLADKTALKAVAPEADAVAYALVNDAVARQKRQLDELQRHVQDLMRLSSKVRDQKWATGDRSSVEKWIETSVPLRDWVYDELIGRLPEPTMPMNAKSRLVLDEPEYLGYEITLDCYRDVVAGGSLLLPKDLKPGEKRPVVVCQHGLEGVPMDTITEDHSQRAWNYYKGFAAVLCKRGFITYAPQNPYRGQDRFRTLQRKSNPLKRSLFSYIIPQHQRTLDWLATLPNVDSNRIGFYGLSYGGKTAVRVPPMLTQGKDRVGYCLSICSADFNEWVKKNVSNEDRYSYLFTGEYEIFEWNMGHVANYAELSSLMAPRPFMVERGHDDGVAPDEWVAWEFAKVRRHFDKLGIGENTEIEFFNGPHSINGQGTYRFLHRHLHWPEPSTN